MNYPDWFPTVPAAITGDPLWKVEAYRLSLFLADIGWKDITKLVSDKRTMALSDQLYRAIGSISANLAEGYSKSSGKDRVRFYEYSLGSARETRGWYYKARHILGDAVTNHRLQFTAQIIRLLMTMIPDQREVTLREEPAENEITLTDLDTLLFAVPEVMRDP
ncbi:MAG: four helix bundle protein [Verrucomicrobiaceae bacterium]|nr:four helix bundle protein [Verrucomicrobiaceae bacterium]